MKEGKVKGAALDVIEYEEQSFNALDISSLPPPFQYLKMAENVILNPHLAGISYESVPRHAYVMAQKFQNYLSSTCMLNELREMEGNVDIVYNIAEVLPGLYLPNAYVVSKDKLGNLAHIKQKATPETVVSFKLPINESQNRLFQIINDLLPDKLEKNILLKKES